VDLNLKLQISNSDRYFLCGCVSAKVVSAALSEGFLVNSTFAVFEGHETMCYSLGCVKRVLQHCSLLSLLLLWCTCGPSLSFCRWVTHGAFSYTFVDSRYFVHCAAVQCAVNLRCRKRFSKCSVLGLQLLLVLCPAHSSSSR